MAGPQVTTTSHANLARQFGAWTQPFPPACSLGDVNCLPRISGACESFATAPQREAPKPQPQQSGQHARPAQRGGVLGERKGSHGGLVSPARISTAPSRDRGLVGLDGCDRPSGSDRGGTAATVWQPTREVAQKRDSLNSLPVARGAAAESGNGDCIIGPTRALGLSSSHPSLPPATPPSAVCFGGHASANQAGAGGQSRHPAGLTLRQVQSTPQLEPLAGVQRCLPAGSAHSGASNTGALCDGRGGAPSSCFEGAQRPRPLATGQGVGAAFAAEKVSCTNANVCSSLSASLSTRLRNTGGALGNPAVGFGIDGGAAGGQRTDAPRDGGGAHARPRRVHNRSAASAIDRAVPSSRYNFASRPLPCNTAAGVRPNPATRSPPPLNRTCNVDADTEVPETLFYSLLQAGKDVKRRGQHVMVPSREERSSNVPSHLVHQDLFDKGEFSTVLRPVAPGREDG